MQAKGVMLAAPKSGSGKTLIACALLQVCRNRRIPVNAFKCGPDFIDPMFHKNVIGVPSHNLDPFFSDEKQLKRLFDRNRSEAEISVIEGVMGLYDGLGGIQREGSSYQVAQALDVPIVLVVDARGMGFTLIPVLEGLLRFDTQKRIAGVILNRIGKPFCDTIAPVIEKELSLSVFGCFPYEKELAFDSRHLGLKLPAETEGLREKIKKAASLLEQNVDLERLFALLAETDQKTSASAAAKEQQKPETKTEPVCRIAVAKDEAFQFYYEENLDALRAAGAELVFFSPLHDASLPEGTDGVLLGGGYPELFAAQLSANRPMREAIRRAIGEGMPSVAECGGFLYLHDTLITKEQESYPMAGVIPAVCSDQGKLVRFGYVNITQKRAGFFKEAKARIKGHEFHYFDSTQNGNSCVAQKPVGEKRWDCIWSGEDHWWGFPHLYYPSNPQFAASFAECCRNYRGKKTSRQQ